jgi:fatty acid desaturase
MGVADDPKAKLVGIDGSWYDITDILPQHPGGPVLSEFVGKDATAVFNALRHKDVLTARKPVGKYEMKEKHPAHQDFVDLHEKLIRDGYYKPAWGHYIRMMSFIGCLLGAVFALVLGTDKWYLHYLAAVLLGTFWIQAGGVFHEIFHNSLNAGKTLTKAMGLLFGSVGFGWNTQWWLEYHTMHHGITNTVDLEKKTADPQIWKPSYVQNSALFDLYPTSQFNYIIKFQHLTFFLYACLARYRNSLYGLMIERRWYGVLAICLHWYWYFLLMSHLPTWSEVRDFFLIATVTNGLWYGSFLLSHLDSNVTEIKEFHADSWYVQMITNSSNIKVPQWCDFLFAGFPVHIEHHLFPAIPRTRLSKVKPYVMAICKKHNVKYEQIPVLSCFKNALIRLRDTSIEYSKLELM